jgi:hypothetical protein
METQFISKRLAVEIDGKRFNPDTTGIRFRVAENLPTADCQLPT